MTRASAKPHQGVSGGPRYRRPRKPPTCLHGPAVSGLKGLRGLLNQGAPINSFKNVPTKLNGSGLWAPNSKVAYSGIMMGQQDSKLGAHTVIYYVI